MTTPRVIRRFPATAEEREYIVGAIKSRRDFINADCHGIAYLLDILYLGRKMDDDLTLRTVDQIWEYPLRVGQSTSPEEKSSIRTEFDNYQLWARALKIKSPASFDQFDTGRRSMLNYFLTEGGERWPLLKNLAARIFSLVSTSACVERSNSVMGFIQNTFRSRLKHEKVVKLSYIKSNAAQVFKDVDIDLLRAIAEEESTAIDESEIILSDGEVIE